MAFANTFQQELKASLQLSLPIAGAQLAHIALSITDNIMCGQLGASALAGAGLGSATLSMVLLPLLGLVGVVSAFASEAHGADDPSSVQLYTRQALLLSLLLAVPAIWILGQARLLFEWMGHSAELIAVADSYLEAARWSVLPALGVAVLRGFLESLSYPRPGLMIGISAIGINILGNLALMFGWWGLPALGVAGTGWSTTLVNVWMFLSLWLTIQILPELRRYQVFKHNWRLDTRVMYPYFKVGLPVALGILSEVWLFSGLALLMGKLGETALAAHQIALSMATVTFMFALGVSYATTVRVGYAQGQLNLTGARQAGAIGMGVGMAVMSCSGLCFWLFPEALIGLYLDLNQPENQRVARLATELLALAAFFQLFDALQVTSQGALRGLKDTFVPMLIAFGCYWLIGYGSAVWLAFDQGLGPRGLWLGLIVGLISAALLLASRFFWACSQALQQKNA